MIYGNTCIFDSDTDLINVDNSANCIVWKNKKSYIAETYKLVNMESLPSINTAAGQGTAVGIRDINISWDDDFGKLHQFVLKDVFHIPDSPVNILGISVFSKLLGDYEKKGRESIPQVKIRLSLGMLVNIKGHPSTRMLIYRRYL